MAGLNGVPTSGGLRGSGANAGAGASLSTSTTSIEGGTVDAGKTGNSKMHISNVFLAASIGVSWASGRI